MNQQAAITRFDESAHLAYNRVMAVLSHRKQEIISMARARLILGFSTYNGEMFEWDEAKLMREASEELADAIVYLHLVV